ncbi:hypothetical protein ALC62_11076 [Cyphomyrmex costatus]|uniref:Uncharacterized protein n=1 Tax=Cyphomyrmex costatus TaxID=456900 RepID=A0A151ICV7_9HYME|nr:hypothetical protein ALC62_11076 [Cyphomyrmex costatus]
MHVYVREWRDEYRDAYACRVRWRETERERERVREKKKGVTRRWSKRRNCFKDNLCVSDRESRVPDWSETRLFLRRGCFLLRRWCVTRRRKKKKKRREIGERQTEIEQHHQPPVALSFCKRADRRRQSVNRAHTWPIAVRYMHLYGVYPKTRASLVAKKRNGSVIIRLTRAEN